MTCGLARRQIITAVCCRIAHKIKLLIRQGLDAPPNQPVASGDTGDSAALFLARIRTRIKMPDSNRKSKKAPANCYSKNVRRAGLLLLLPCY